MFEDFPRWKVRVDRDRSRPIKYYVGYKLGRAECIRDPEAFVTCGRVNVFVAGNFADIG